MKKIKAEKKFILNPMTKALALLAISAGALSANATVSEEKSSPRKIQQKKADKSAKRLNDSESKEDQEVFLLTSSITPPLQAAAYTSTITFLFK